MNEFKQLASREETILNCLEIITLVQKLTVQRPLGKRQQKSE